MPSTSEAQARFMAACSHGAGYDSCPPAKVSKDFNQADKGSSILSNAMRSHHAFGGGIGGKTSFPHLGSVHISSGGGQGTQVAHPMSMGQAMPPWVRSEAHEMNAPIHPGFGGMGRPHRAPGGMMSMGMAEPAWTRSEARQINDVPFHSGLINSAVAGRTDRLPLAVGSDSHVIPADAVSGAGQGNSSAGARNWQAAIHSGPWGVELPKAVHGHGPPAAPHPSGAQTQTGLAEGGNAKTSILAAGGEVVVPPEYVRQLGERGIRDGHGKRGESAMALGHRLIDEAIAHVRKFNISWLKKAPPPKT